MDDDQASVVEDSTLDNSSDTENPEQGSEETTQSQEHRNFLEMAPEEILTSHPGFTDVERLIQSHPGLKSYVARYGKSERDKGFDHGKSKAQEELERNRAKENFKKFVDDADEYDLGKWYKDQYKQNEELQPVLEIAKREGFDIGWTEGQNSGKEEGKLEGLRVIGVAAEQALPFWKEMDEGQRRQYMSTTQSPEQFLTKLIKDGIKRGYEESQNKVKEKEKRENEIEDRTKEPTPDIGGGSKPGGNLLTQAEFDANRSNQTWLRNNLSRMQEAYAAGRITK